jgi:G3E family GTPase
MPQAIDACTDRDVHVVQLRNTDPGSSCSNSSSSSGAAAGGQLPLQVAVQRQLLSADVILINKIDLITEQQKVSITAVVAALTPRAGQFQFHTDCLNIHNVLQVPKHCVDIRSMQYSIL